MFAFLIPYVLKLGIPERFAKPLIFGALGLLILGVLWGGKCAYDNSIITKHYAKVEAVTAKADRTADAHASDQRRTDDSRSTQESTQIKETVDEARRTGADPRAAYYACVRKQQSARRAGQSPPNC